MKLLLAVMTAAALAGPAVGAQPSEGLWRAADTNSQIEIYSCGVALCGRLLTSDDIRTDPAVTDANNRNPAFRHRSLKGLVMLSGFTGGPRQWTGGEAYNPVDGATYHGSIRLEGQDSLKLTGCIFPPLCKTARWTRVR